MDIVSLALAALIVVFIFPFYSYCGEEVDSRGPTN